jgi:hypothetical protein
MVNAMSDIQKEHAIETYKSLIKISIEGIKFIALINGGAAVALLAYLGNVTGKNLPIPDMSWPIGFFLLGLVFCGLAFVASYITQLILFNESMNRPVIFPHTFWLYPAIFVAILSILAFALGSYLAIIRFQNPSAYISHIMTPK